MKQATELLVQVNEASFTIQRHKAIRNGKVVLLRTRKYAGPQEREGYKRNEEGRLVRMSPLERRRRSRAQKRAQNKAGAKRHRENSMRRRENLINVNDKK